MVDVDERVAERRSLDDETADTVEIDFLKVPTALRMFAHGSCQQVRVMFGYH